MCLLRLIIEISTIEVPWSFLGSISAPKARGVFPKRLIVSYEACHFSMCWFFAGAVWTDGGWRYSKEILYILHSCLVHLTRKRINRNWFQLLKGQRSFLCSVSFKVDNRDFDDRGSVNFPRFHLSFKGKRLGVFWGVFPKRLIVSYGACQQNTLSSKARGVFPQTLHCIVSGSLMRCKKERGITTASTGPTKNPSIKSGERQPQFLFIRSKNWWAN